jgi:hypothetical protein
VALDDDLVRDVEAARQKLELLETAVFDARAEFHQAIRRLHTGGASMREIANALGMSHQRVHQIIGEDAIVEVEATSTDVTPHPNASVSVTAAEDACSFCGTPRRKVEKLLAAPGRSFICDACVERAAGELSPVDLAECDFCRQATESAFERNGALICAECVRTCERIIDPPAEAAEAKRTVMRRRSPVMRCSFCNASQAQVEKLVAGPGVYICGSCVAAAQEVASTGEATSGPRRVGLLPAIREQHPCSFCGLRTPSVDRMVKGARARICNDCLALCDTVIDEAAAG